MLVEEEEEVMVDVEGVTVVGSINLLFSSMIE